MANRSYIRLAALLLFLNAVFVVFFNMSLFSRRVSTSVHREKYVSLTREDLVLEGAHDLDNYTMIDSEETNLIYKHIDSTVGLYDKSRVFKLYPFVIKSKKWSDLTSWNVCLSTQASANLLFWIAEQADTWKGPISVSVFVPDMDYTVAVLMIQYMRSCFTNVRDRVSFHMVYPEVMPPKYHQIDGLEFDCLRPEDVNHQLVKLIRTEKLLKTIAIARYPQNLMRNVARQGCQSKYCFTPDIDMISIPSLSSDINEFLAKKSTNYCMKCAFIVPTYEISERAQKRPENKKELQEFINKRLARIFHIKVFANNQANSKLEEWEKLNPGKGVDIAYNITTWGRHWEPIYVAKSNVPAFDERFIGYGFTRNSQVYEMRVAGYSWHMLDNVFLTHRGFQTKKTQSRVRKKQIAENNGRYDVFLRELYQRYGVVTDDAESEAVLKNHNKRMKDQDNNEGEKKKSDAAGGTVENNKNRNDEVKDKKKENNRDDKQLIEDTANDVAAGKEELQNKREINKKFEFVKAIVEQVVIWTAVVIICLIVLFLALLRRWSVL